MNQGTNSFIAAIAYKISILLFILFFSFNIFDHLLDVKYIDCIDLRNRVIGARLINQKVSPYYYKWHPSDPITLFDPADYCNIKNNLITAPPSLLLLIEPLAKLDYSSICYVWMAIQYLFFLLTFLPIFFLFKSNLSRTLIAIAGILLLFSDYWNDSVLRGQSHFILPAIIASILLLSSSGFLNKFVLVGFLFSLLIWIRPNAILIVPFTFLCPKSNKRQLLIGLIAGGFLFGALTLVFNQTHYWFDFYSSCKEWIKINTSGLRLTRCNWPVHLEKTITPTKMSLHERSELADINSLSRSIFHFTIHPIYLTSFFILAYLSALLISIKKPAHHFSEVILWGMLLYWFGEITTPVPKMSYYYVELFVVVLFLWGKWERLYLIERILLVIAFLFAFLDPLPMNLFLGELCTVTCLAIYLLRKKFHIADAQSPINDGL